MFTRHPSPEADNDIVAHADAQTEAGFEARLNPRTPTSRARGLLAEHFRHAHVHLASGWSTALYTALLLCGVSKDDEVIMSALSPAGVAHAIMLTGARPIFVDVDSDTLLISTQAVEAAITERTRAVIVSHLYGQVAQYGPLYDTLHERGLSIIEEASDAFCAMGNVPSPARDCDLLVGCLPDQRGIDGDLPAFLVTRSDLFHSILEQWTSLNDGSVDETKSFDPITLDTPMVRMIGAIDAQLDDRFAHEIQYALHLQPLIDRQIERYNLDFADCDLRLLAKRTDIIRSLRSFPIHVRAETRDDLFESLVNSGFRVYHSYRNLAEVAFFAARESHPVCPNASQWAHGVISLPTGDFLSSREQNLLDTTVKNSLLYGSDCNS